MDATAFRDLMAVVPTPVTVITTCDEAGPAGTTVSAFTSLSLDPRLVLVSLDNRSGLLSRIRQIRRFGVNLLADGQGDVALIFARSGERFDQVQWAMESGLPRLDGVSAWIECSLAYELPAGDHTILAGHVDDAAVAGAPALVYSDRVFGTNSTIAQYV